MTNKFVGLLSVGDIQRAVIKNLPLDTMVKECSQGTDITVARTSDDMVKIRAKMLEESD